VVTNAPSFPPGAGFSRASRPNALGIIQRPDRVAHPNPNGTFKIPSILFILSTPDSNAKPRRGAIVQPRLPVVFCGFLALMLLKELEAKMEARGWTLHWERVKNDLDDLEEITVRNSGKTFVIRSRTRGDAGKAIQAVGVALGSTVRLCEAKLP